jgi:hypothetical protein
MPTTTSPTPAYPSRSAAYGRDRRRQQAYGRWQPYIDAEPARAHVRHLMAYGIGWMHLAQQAGVPKSTVEKLLYGSPPRNMAPSKRIRPETASKLLALRPDPALLAGGADTDSTGTIRRLHALVAAGWPQSHLADRLDVNPANFGKTLRSPRVLMATDRAVRALYDQLWKADPREHGVSLHSYNQSRNHAAARGWAPVGAWDDDTIDDPAAFPDWTGDCGTPKGARAHYHHQILPLCDPCRDAAAAERRERRSTEHPPNEGPS